MRISVIISSLLLVLGFLSGDLFAQTVKKWVDEEGVTHYSDQVPVNGRSGVDEFELPEANVTEFEAGETTERIKNKARQLEREREARERQAGEKQRAQALEEALEREPITVEEKKKKRKKKKKGDAYRGPYPKPLPGPFPRPLPGPYPKPVVQD